ncbi:hypothetical protein RB653_010558 [Dictyostelium firmibasis]|uniref:EGF-like domain-containing protein n=1 Tax=Dictyostelium firmibasis TaxID=79012 RepID=A0AAN7YW09_9MYCE
MRIFTILFSFFFLLINSGLLNSEFILTDITPNNKLINYPDTTSSKTCTSYHYILVNGSNQGTINQIIPYSFFLSSNSDSVIYYAYQSLNIGESKQINFTVNDLNQTNGYLTVNFICKEVDVSLVTIDIIQNVTWSDNLKYSSIVRLNGVPDEATMPINVNAIINRMGNSLYRIIYREPYYTNNLQNSNQWDIDLQFSVNQILKVSVPFNKLNPIVFVKDIKEYQVNKLKYAGLFGGTLLFEVNSTIQRPIFSSFTMFDPYYQTPKPISGVKGDVLYYLNLISAVPGNQTYSLYSQNEDDSFKTILNKTIEYTLPTINPLGQSIATSDNSSELMNFITVKFDGASDYNFGTINCVFKNIFDNGFNYGFPFGFISGNNNINKMSISTPITSKSNQKEFTWNCGSTIVIVNDSLFIQESTTSRPTITSLENINIYGFSFLAIFKATDDYGVKYIGVFQNIFNKIGSESLVSGDTKNGVWEYLYDGVNLGGDTKNSISISSEMDTSTSYFPGLPFSISDINQTILLPQIELNSPVNYYRDIKDISFMFNNVHVTNQSVDNIMYFTFDNINNYKNLSIGFTLTDPKSLKDINYQSDIFMTLNLKYIFAQWDESKGRFSVMFKMPANTVPGVLDWTLTFAKYNTLINTALPEKYQLNIISENIDISGPIVTNIIKKSPSDFGTSNVGWLLTIEDDINGILNGYIIVKGVLDSSSYNFTISPSTSVTGSGDKWKADYLISIPIQDNLNSYGCIAQDYSITYAKLEDSFGNINKFVAFPVTSEEIANPLSIFSNVNPFYLFNIDSLTVSVDSTTCNTALDTTEPTLISFTSSKSSIDVGSQDRSIRFDFKAQDLESGLKNNQYPIVYLITENLESVECISTIVSRTSTETIYTCTTEVPIGFGYPLGFTVSVFGFINNGGYYSGFSSDLIKSIGSNSYFISTIQSMDIPIIMSSTGITNQGGDVWINGRGFLLSDTATITYSDGNKITKTLTNNIYNSVLLIPAIKATNQSFTIQVYNSSQPTKTSNLFTITPQLFFFNYTDPVPTQSPTPTTSSQPTKSPIPTNPPQKCSGNPECGGANQGVCTKNGCVCLSPWYGKDCTSKLVEVVPPIINGSNPSVEIPIPGDNGGSSTTGGSTDLPSQIIYKSLISIVSLRELDFNGNAIKNIPLNSWVFSEINSTISRYDTSVSVEGKNEKVNVTTTMQWFSNSSTVTFAGQQLKMNPSTIKFNVDITTYPFSSSLNSLQLVMSATLLSSSTNNDICSSKSFGDTSNGDDSNFIKLQIDDHSVYGRFLKRAIVDGLIISVDNILLDDSMNTIESDTHAQQSYIGIIIPHYNKLISIDPDFSVLIDQHPASKSSDNSICSNKSGLTKGQISGIAIGAAGFAAVVVISVIYSVNKTKKNKKLLNSISKKIESVNK